MKFTKMHGLGNDYIYVNTIDEGERDYSKLAIKYSERHFGIGADGIITISKSDRADFFMQIYNADGSKGEMCGNGIRCVGKYVFDNGLTDKTNISIDTLAGIKYLELKILDGKVDSVKVNMGIPTTHQKDKLSLEKVSHKLQIDNKEYEVMDVSMGNPHTVIFVPKITDELVLEIGPKIENNSYYPNRTNVEFVEIIDETNLKMRVWERGSGETMACGTGACATAVAYLLKNNINKEMTIHLRGGNLIINWNKEDNNVYMEGPATKVFDGEISDIYE